MGGGDGKWSAPGVLLTAYRGDVPENCFAFSTMSNPDGNVISPSRISPSRHWPSLSEGTAILAHSEREADSKRMTGQIRTGARAGT